MIKLGVTGTAGKMGAAILKLAFQEEGIEVTGALEAKGHPSVGKTLEAPAGRTPVTISDDPDALVAGCDVIIDFTEANASLGHFAAAERYGKAIVIGTTGFSVEALAKIQGAKAARVVISPNMSVGMNLMFDMVEKVSRILKGGYDVEIVEMHHRLKKDAPSGTAVKLMEVVETAQPDREWMEVFGRKGLIGERKENEIGVLALRGGDVVGEHTVMFAGTGERLELTHRAYSRENFARGALVAAKWAVRKDPGVYSMKDVLGLG